MVMTLAPLSAAQTMPSAMVWSLPPPCELRTWTGMRPQPGATPAVPTPLPTAAAAMPAQ
ncbi:hypothetical protein D3C87_1832170 [compost metagenome]